MTMNKIVIPSFRSMVLMIMIILSTCTAGEHNRNPFIQVNGSNVEVEEVEEVEAKTS